MTHWIRVVALSALPLIGVLGAVPALAADPPKHIVAVHAAHAKSPAAPVMKTAPVKSTPGSQVMLNPQPIPPGKVATAQTKTNPGSQVMLNPQPIPPGKVATAQTKTKTMPKAKTGSP